MNLLASMRVALRALRVNGLRTLLAVLSVSMGVGAVITMMAVGAGAQAGVEEQIQSLGSTQFIIRPGSVNSRGVWLGFGARWTLTEGDAYAIDREIIDVEIADPGLGGGARLVAGNKNWLTSFWGASHKHFELRGFKLAAGRPFSWSEVQSSAKVIVIGETVSRELFGDADPVGQVLRVNRVPFTIIGLWQRKGQNSAGRDQDDGVLLPITTFRNRIVGTAHFRPGAVEMISVRVREGSNIAQVERDIRGLLRQRHHLFPGQKDDFIIQNMSEVLAAREKTTRIMTLFLAAVASVSLLVGGVGVMNVMLMSVTERTREIGIRMAVGARGRDILAQFLVEAITLALLGGLLGVLIGFVASHAIGYFVGWRIALHVDSVTLAVGVAGVIGIFFGFYPARKASRLMPIDALRYE